MSSTRVHLLVSGRVQGVFYRATAQEQATALGLKGWVRNLPSGDVEAEVEGPAEEVERFIAWCRIGPPDARVDKVQVEKGTFRGDLGPFAVRH